MEKLNDKKLYIIMGLLIIAILIVLRSLIVSNNEAIIKYNEFDSISEILSFSDVITDRSVYYALEDIITKFVSSNSFESGSKFSLEDFYEVLNKSYKNKISKSEFLKRGANFCNKLQISESSGMGVYSYYISENVIRTIYRLYNNAYVCVVSLPEDKSNVLGYLGVILDQEKNTYEIFYIE